MEIPILNSIYGDLLKSKIKSNSLDLSKINNLQLVKPDEKKFKVLKILKLIPKNDSLFETILIAINDELVSMFLNKQIDFNMISILLIKIINFKIFKKYCNVKPKSVEQIFKARSFAKLIVNNYVNKLK